MTLTNGDAKQGQMFNEKLRVICKLKACMYSYLDVLKVSTYSTSNVRSLINL